LEQHGLRVMMWQFVEFDLIELALLGCACGCGNRPSHLITQLETTCIFEHVDMLYTKHRHLNSSTRSFSSLSCNL